MHGGIGMTDEYDIGFYMKRARVLAEMFGDANFHRRLAGRRGGLLMTDRIGLDAEIS